MGYVFGVDKLNTAGGEIAPGTNMMLIGPAMSGKSVFARNFLYGNLKQGAAIFISTKDTGENILDWFNANNMEIDPSKFGIVDCVSRTLGMDAYVEDTENIKRVSSPFDLTGISVKVNEFLEYFWKEQNIKSICIVVESLSTLLMYSNVLTVFRFLHVFTSRIKSVGATCLYVLEEGMHEPQIMATLKQFFQGVVALQEEGGKKTVRIIGSPRSAGPFAFEIEGVNVKITE